MDRLSSLMTRAIGSGASVAEPTTRMRNTAEASKACGEIPQPQTSCQNRYYAKCYNGVALDMIGPSLRLPAYAPERINPKQAWQRNILAILQLQN